MIDISLDHLLIIWCSDDCHLWTQLQGCVRGRCETRSGPSPSEGEGRNCERKRARAVKITWRVNKCDGLIHPHVAYHHAAHAPVSELWAREVLMFLHLQDFSRADSGVGRSLTNVFSSLKEQADPPTTRRVDFRSITTAKPQSVPVSPRAHLLVLCTSQVGGCPLRKDRERQTHIA